MTTLKLFRLLLVNMEYSQAEINEPLNMDILLQYIPKEIYRISDIVTVYRDLPCASIKRYNEFDVVLISSKLSSYYQMTSIISQCENKIVIVGGIIAICAYEELAVQYPNIILSTGEAETNQMELLRLAAEYPDPVAFKQAIINKHIPNVAFIHPQYNEIYISNRNVFNLTNSKKLEHHTTNKIINCNGLVRMETSRGCPWNQCTFCVMPWKYCGNTWRPFPLSHIAYEIVQLKAKGATQILFTDEDFVANKDHILSLCKLIKENQRFSERKIKFGGSTSVYTLCHLDDYLDICLEAMKDAGIETIFLGIESGCDAQLKRYRKGVSVAMNERIILKLKQYKFQIDIGFIMFDAETTMEELEENLTFIYRTGLNNNVSRFTKKLRVTPHTYFYKLYKEKKLITSDLNLNELYYEYSFCDPAISIIYQCLEKLDRIILEESYRLQAVIRSRDNIGVRMQAEHRLLRLREYGFLFLNDCVNIYKKNNSLSSEAAEVILKKYTIRKNH